MDAKSWNIKKMPVGLDIETRKILKALPKAHAALAELKGLASTIPNQHILINTLGLQEAKDSSAIENIITTHDDLYKSTLDLEGFNSPNAKEVQNYASALKLGYELVKQHKLLTGQTILKIQEELEKNQAGYRKLPGTSLKNAATGEVIYEPPQSGRSIISLMSKLEKFINDPEMSDYDPLVKMAIIHHQFESIHPFYDGNGRTGRIINILYLIIEGLLNLPILYLSNYVIRHKAEYYRLLQHVRDTGEWEEWLLYMIRGVEETAVETISLIEEIKVLMARYKTELRSRYKFYSHDLLNNLFRHPYTKIEFVEKELDVSRQTAAAYINKLAKDGYLKKEKVGKANYYINSALYTLLQNR